MILSSINVGSCKANTVDYQQIMDLLIKLWNMWEMLQYDGGGETLVKVTDVSSATAL